MIYEGIMERDELSMSKEELGTLALSLEKFCCQYIGCIGCPVKNMFDFLYTDGCPIFKFRVYVSKEYENVIDE